MLFGALLEKKKYLPNSGRNPDGSCMFACCPLYGVHALMTIVWVVPQVDGQTEQHEWDAAQQEDRRDNDIGTAALAIALL